MKQVIKTEGKKSSKMFMLAWDLYWLRYMKSGDKWYELTDYLRDKLVEDGHTIEYLKDTMVFDGFDMRNV